MNDTNDLTEKDKKLIYFLKKQKDNYKLIFFNALFSLIVGSMLLLSGLTYLEKIYSLAGLYFITIGIFIIITNLQYRRIHQLIEKLQRSNRP